MAKWVPVAMERYKNYLDGNADHVKLKSSVQHAFKEPLTHATVVQQWNTIRTQTLGNVEDNILVTAPSKSPTLAWKELQDHFAASQKEKMELKESKESKKRKRSDQQSQPTPNAPSVDQSQAAAPEASQPQAAVAELAPAGASASQSVAEDVAPTQVGSLAVSAVNVDAASTQVIPVDKVVDADQNHDVVPNVVE